MKRLTAIILAALLVFALASGAMADDEKVLRVGTTETGGGFDPTVNTSTYLGLNLVYESLFKIDQQTGELVPYLVEDYYFEDEVTLVMTLKDGVTFSNGEPLTGEDVIYSLRRYVDEGTMLATYFAYFDFDASTVSDDGLTVTLKYTEPYGAAQAFLTKAIECKKNDEGLTPEDTSWWDAPVGTGPYEVVENVSGSHTTYALRDDYWGEEPDADIIEITYYSDQTTMFIDFENGAIDVALNLATSDYSRLENGEMDNVVYGLCSQNATQMVCFNMESVPAFQDIRVREAFAHAIDYEAVTDAAYEGLGMVATSTLGVNTNFYYNVGTYEYDPELAISLLEEAGYGDGLELNVVITSSAANTKLLEAMQAYLADVGITLNFQSYDVPTAVGYFREGGTDFQLQTVNGGNEQCEPHLAYSAMYPDSIFPCVRIDDAELQELLNAALYSTDDAVREENYRAVQQWLYDNYMAIPICESATAYVYNTDTVAEFPLVSTATCYLQEVVLP